MTVSPPAYRGPVRRGGFNPWRELRAREHLRLRWATIHGCREMIRDEPCGRCVYLDHRLGRIDRNWLLAHALVHDERFLFRPGTPEAVVAKEEAYVARETARRLVPLDQLNDFVMDMVDIGEAVTAAMVALRFDVPEEVADLALYLLAMARQRAS